MLIASNGHFLTQIPQPMHSSSEMNAIWNIARAVHAHDNDGCHTHEYGAAFAQLLQEKVEDHGYMLAQRTLDAGVTSIHILPCLTTGQCFLHSCKLTAGTTEALCQC